jgi:hypothetical protein
MPAPPRSYLPMKRRISHAAAMARAGARGELSLVQQTRVVRSPQDGGW